MSGTFRSLKVRNNRIFLSGRIVSMTGSWVQMIAQDWLVLELSGNSGTALGIVMALQFLPMMLLALYAGVLADRFDKRTLLIIVQSAMAVLALSLGTLVVTGVVQLWHVFLFAGLQGLAEAFDTPTRQAFVSELVGTELLPNAVALNSATFNTARLIGPAAGGLLIAAVGVGPAFFINALSFGAVIVGLAMIRPQELLRGKRVKRAKGQIRTALRHVAEHGDLVRVFAIVLVVGTMGMNFVLTLPLLAKVEFGVGPAQFGLLGTALAAGALVGALIGTRRKGRPSARLHLALAGAFGVLELVVAVSPTFTWAMALLVPTGAVLIGHNNVANARVQLGVPDFLRGRVMALYVLVFLGGTPVGSLVVGSLAERYGARAGLAVGGLSVLLAVAVALFLVLRPRRAALWPGRVGAEAELRSSQSAA